MEKNNILKSQKGVSLIITFFIMIIILAVVLSVSSLLYSEVKVIRNIGDSMVSFYAADSGIEKVVYYDRQVLPFSSNGKTHVQRGFCSIFDTCVPSNSGDPSIYCNAVPGGSNPPVAVAGTIDPNNGCNPNVCDDCTISFGTVFDNLRNYSIIAVVNQSGLDIQSVGAFGSAERKIEIDSSTSH